MQGLILVQHEHQCSPRLLQRLRNGTVGESLTQLTHPGLHRFRSVHQLSAFPLLRVRSLQAPHVLFIRPNRYSRTPRTAAPVSTLRLLTSWLLLTYPVASDLQRGGLCSREMLIVEP